MIFLSKHNRAAEPDDHCTYNVNIYSSSYGIRFWSCWSCHMSLVNLLLRRVRIPLRVGGADVYTVCKLEAILSLGLCCEVKLFIFHLSLVIYQTDPHAKVTKAPLPTPLFCIIWSDLRFFPPCSHWHNYEKHPCFFFIFLIWRKSSVIHSWKVSVGLDN